MANPGMNGKKTLQKYGVRPQTGFIWHTEQEPEEGRYEHRSEQTSGYHKRKEPTRQVARRY
jgi:hypothetical protein